MQIGIMHLWWKILKVKVGIFWESKFLSPKVHTPKIRPKGKLTTNRADATGSVKALFCCSGYSKLYRAADLCTL